MAKVNFDEWCSEIDCTNNARFTFNGKFYCDRHALYILQDIANEHGENAAQQGVHWTLLESGKKVGTCPTCGNVQIIGLPSPQSQ